MILRQWHPAQPASGDDNQHSSPAVESRVSLMLHKLEVLQRLESGIESDEIDLTPKRHRPDPQAGKWKSRDGLSTSEQLTNPTARSALWKLARDSQDTSYRELLGQLQLPTEREQKLRDHLADLNMTVADFQSIYKGPGGTARDLAFAGACAPIFSDIRDLIGEQQEAQLLNYISNGPGRAELSVLTAKLEAFGSLSPETRESLNSAWFSSIIRSSSDQDAAAAALLSPGALVALDESRLTESLHGLLSAEESKTLTRFLAEHKATSAAK